MSHCLLLWSKLSGGDRRDARFRALFLILSVLSSQLVFAQNTIRGKVSSGDTAVAYATVQIKGSAVATQTDNGGNFAINATANSTLVISSIGYSTLEVPVNNRMNINVALQTSSNKQLEEVVVVGYGTQRRKDLTGSVSSVTAAQIEKVPVTTLDQALQGRSSGVQVTNNDGAPGGGVQLQIRGVGSFGANDPLYVVDGYPVSGGINTLNPNDIATIDVLKDASATAIYGNRASNGVVIITTKRGSRNNVQVSVDAIGSVQSRPKMYDVLNAQQFATLANAHATTDGYTALPEWANPSSLTNADWQDAIYQSGLRQNYNVALRGGNEKILSSFSAGYFDQKGIVLGSDYKRINLSLNLDYNATSWLKSSSSFKYTRGNTKIPFGTGGQGATAGIGYLSKLPPTVSGNQLTSMIKDAAGNYGFFNPNNQSVRNWGSGPLYNTEMQDQKNLTNNFLGSTSLEATIVKGLRIKSNLGINTNDYSGYYFTPSDTRAADQYGTSTQTAQNFYSQSANNSFEWLWENTIAYTKTFGNHSIDFVGGVSAQENTFRQIGAQGNNLPSDVLRDLGSLPALTKIYGNQVTYSLASQFGRINYSFKDKYLFTATVRRDGSSRFAPGQQYGVFPSGSVAWRIKEESFLQNVNALSDLKIRASYGQIGSQFSAGTFKYLAQYTSGPAATDAANNGYPFNGVYQPGLVLASLPNPDLKWETSDQTDIGIDAAFLDNSLTLTVDYYRKESRDFLLKVPTAPQTGFTSAYRNVGSIRNSGIEVALNYTHSKGGAFTYGVGLNFSTVSNKVLSLATGQEYINNLSDLEFSTTGSNNWGVYSRSYVGGPVGQFYGYKSAGIFQSQKEIDDLNAIAVAKYGANLFYQTTSGPSKSAVVGDRKFVDVNNDGRITADDQTALGSPIPKFFGGINLDASFKGFDLNAFIYGVSGNKIFNYQERTLESFGSSTGSVGLENIGVDYFNNAWTSSNPSQRYAIIDANEFNANTRPSDVYVEDGSYLRLRNLQLGYTFPASTIRGISRIRVYVSAQNLFTITKYSGLDPEIGVPSAKDPETKEIVRNVTASGIDVGTYPSSKFYTLGINVTL
jgi:TonB-linked SusC/RagA family outer membrane protein